MHHKFYFIRENADSETLIQQQHKTNVLLAVTAKSNDPLHGFTTPCSQKTKLLLFFNS